MGQKGLIAFLVAVIVVLVGVAAYLFGRQGSELPVVEPETASVQEPASEPGSVEPPPVEEPAPVPEPEPETEPETEPEPPPPPPPKPPFIPGVEPVSPTVKETPEPAYVRYEEAGFGFHRFAPSEVRVKVGQTVIWRNADGGPLWVASDPHPTHTNYPGFDQKGTISSPGMEWSFTFTKAGTWGYHNHSKTTARGTVIVEE
jgi:plastocyanin